jgi:glycosyltransferase involved in cell wall biosynthesis
VILRNPYEEFPEDERRISWQVVPNKIKIVYIGTNYQEHHPALKELSTAIDLLGHEKVSLHLFTTQRLVDQNAFGPKTFYHPLALSRINEVYQQADILFLPGAFNSAISEIGRIVSPIHMGQYLASGRPILVYAPSDSFICWYFKKYKCGLIVDQRGPEGLKWAVNKLIDDEALREHLCKNALRQAKVDFSLETTINQFIKLVKPKQARLS